MRRGFTLAEVLITLGLIGVVSAMTLPTVTKGIQSTQRTAQVKAIYNKLNSAYKIALQDAGYTVKCGYWGDSDNPYADLAKTVFAEVDPETGEKSWWYMDGEEKKRSQSVFNGRFDDCKDVGQKMIENLRVKRICEKGGLTNGCFNRPYKGSETYTELFAGCAGLEGDELKKCAITQTSGVANLRSDYLNNKDYVAVLNDGTILFSIKSGWFSPQFFAVDVNGPKGPNKFGYDMFNFASHYAPDGKTLRLQGGNSHPVPKGGTTAKIILEH